MSKEIVVTTTDLQQDYEIISPVLVQISNRGQFKNQLELLEVEYQNLIKNLKDKGFFEMKIKTSRKKDGLERDADYIGIRMEKAFYIALEELKKKQNSLWGQCCNRDALRNGYSQQ